MSNVNDLVTFAKKEFKDKKILDCNGKIFYSDPTKTLKPGKVYLLGYNPGGVPEDYGEDENIKNELDNLPTQTGNSYTDEEWEWRGKQCPKGEHLLQKRVIHLLRSLEETKNPEKVCASNLIFKRSINEKGVNFKDAETCWPVHKKILEVVKPKCIVAFGLKTYNNLFKLLKKDNELGTNIKVGVPIESGYNDLKCRLFKFESDSRIVVVIGVPHLSRYDIDNHQNVIDWIKQHLS